MEGGGQRRPQLRATRRDERDPPINPRLNPLKTPPSRTKATEKTSLRTNSAGARGSRSARGSGRRFAMRLAHGGAPLSGGRAASMRTILAADIEPAGEGEEEERNGLAHLVAPSRARSSRPTQPPACARAPAVPPAAPCALPRSPPCLPGPSRPRRERGRVRRARAGSRRGRRRGGGRSRTAPSRGERGPVVSAAGAGGGASSA